MANDEFFHKGEMTLGMLGHPKLIDQCWLMDAPLTLLMSYFN